MTRRDERESVLMLPPEGDAQQALAEARELLATPPDADQRLLARLERGGIDDEIARHRRRRRRGQLVAALAAAAAVVLAVTVGLRSLADRGGDAALAAGGAAATDEVDGVDAQADGADGAAAVVRAGADAGHPTAIATGPGEASRVVPARGVELAMSENTELTVRGGDDAPVSVALERGRIRVDYAPTAPGQRLVIEAGEVAVTVIGTAFDVHRRADEVEVVVHHGRVRVDWPAGEVMLGEGASWRSMPGAPPDVQRVVEGVGAPPAPAAPGSPGAARAGDALPAPAPDTAASADADGAPSAAAGLDSLEMFALLEQQRGAGIDAGQRLDDLDAFLASYPDSPLAEEVRAQTVEALAAAGRAEDALAAAADYLQRHPAGPRRAQVRWVEATVARDRLHDCARALPAYRELAAAAGPRQPEASYFLGTCAAETGQHDEAREALRDALVQGLDGERAASAELLLQTL